MAPTPIHVFARWKVRDGNMQEVLKILKDLRSNTLAEKGNLFYQVHQSKTDVNTLILFEGYTDESAQIAHVDSEHFKRLAVEQIVPLLEEREVILTIPLQD